MVRRLVDHVVEVDLSESGEGFLVALEDRLEHGHERFGSRPVTSQGGPLSQFPKRHSGPLVMLQEGRNQLRERIDPSPFVEHSENVAGRDRRQHDAMLLQFCAEVLGQLAGGRFMAVGLDKSGLVFGVEQPFPVPRAQILGLIDERWGLSCCGEREMLDVDPGIREIEIGLVLALL